MANLNKVMLIGRLTRDPEPIESKSGGAPVGAKFGFAVNNRKLNQQTQQWENVPVFIDVEIWNRGESKQGDRARETLRKGHQVFIEGHLRMDQWDDKNGGGKRSKLLVVIENFQYLEARQDGNGGGGDAMMSEPVARAPRPPAAATAPVRPAAQAASRTSYPEDEEPVTSSAPPPRVGGGGNNEDEIPF
jgi:single-strand DNA-binding protein